MAVLAFDLGYGSTKVVGAQGQLALQSAVRIEVKTVRVTSQPVGTMFDHLRDEQGEMRMEGRAVCWGCSATMASTPWVSRCTAQAGSVRPQPCVAGPIPYGFCRDPLR